MDGLIKQLQSTKPPQKKQAAAIDPIRQAELWESGVLGPSTPLSLVDAVISLYGNVVACLHFRYYNCKEIEKTDEQQNVRRGKTVFKIF